MSDKAGRAAHKNPRGPTLRRFLTPRFTRAQLIIGVLCALVGLGLVTQVRQQAGAQYADLRQDELVQVLEQLNTRSDELSRQENELKDSITQLQSGADKELAAQQAAKQQAEINEILAAAVPVTGPGIVLDVIDAQNKVSASRQVHVLEELRNAGAEAIELNGKRVGTRSWIADGDGGIVLDGAQLHSPYTWRAIGGSQTMEAALSIPGGAVQSLKGTGASASIQQVASIEIASVVDNPAPKYAHPDTSD